MLQPLLSFVDSGNVTELWVVLAVLRNRGACDMWEPLTPTASNFHVL